MVGLGPPPEGGEPKVPPPPPATLADVAQIASTAPGSGPLSGTLPTLGMLVASTALSFPSAPSVTRGVGGSILVRTDAGQSDQDERAFAVRMDAVRSMSAALSASVLERMQRGASLGEAFGGVGRPLSRVRGTGDLCVGPRRGHLLVPFRIADETCFLREDVVLGFELTLSYENGKLATEDGDATPFVQLKGTGAIVLELLGALSSVTLAGSRSVHVRRELVVGWSGRLVPRAIPVSEAPSGQRGLVAFAGEGTVLLAAS
jgi:uncharacterized protein (AIM24 family)